MKFLLSLGHPEPKGLHLERAIASFDAKILNLRDPFKGRKVLSPANAPELDLGTCVILCPGCVHACNCRGHLTSELSQDIALGTVAKELVLLKAV